MPSGADHEAADHEEASCEECCTAYAADFTADFTVAADFAVDTAPFDVAAFLQYLDSVVAEPGETS